MRVASLLLILCSLLASTHSPIAPALHTYPSVPQSVPGIEEWRESLRSFYRAFSAKQLAEGEAPLRHAAEFARRYPRHPYALKTLEYSASALAMQFRYTDAVREYLRAIELSQALGDRLVAANAMNSLSNLYLTLGNVSRALAAAESAVTSFPPRGDTFLRLVLETNRARLLVRQGRHADAQAEFRLLLRQTERLGNLQLQADVWKVVALAHASQGHWRDAELAIRAALDLRQRAGNTDAAADLADLASIQLEAGRAGDALATVHQARAIVPASPRLPPWRLDFLAARVRLIQGKPAWALQLLRQVTATIQKLPAYTLPGDSLRSGVDYSSQIYETFVEAAEAEFRRTGQGALLREAFAAAESGRGAALRGGAPGRAVPAEAAGRYWDLVAQISQSSARLLDHPTDPAQTARHDQLRLRLAELEASFDSNLAPPLPRAALTEQKVRSDEAAIFFQLGERTSWVWTLVNGRDLELHPLPPAMELNNEVSRWRQAAPGPERQAQARRLYRTLFGSLTPAVHRAHRWLLALDGELFRAPLAALVVAQSPEGRPSYLAERHILQAIPGAWALSRRRPARTQGAFLGVGDPVYNTADPRLAQTRPPVFNSDASAMLLPRLPGSAAELAACIRTVTGRPTLLTGASATREHFSAQLGLAPAVVHLALHVVPDPAASADSLVALSLDAHGAPELIGPEWISAQNLPGSFVFMNGCRSGSGTVSRTEGLLGLTRGWLRAGVSRVLSSYWPTRDDGGLFAAEFYKRRAASLFDEAAALQQTQTAMIASQGWQSDPDYWAAYFLIGYPAP